MRTPLLICIIALACGCASKPKTPPPQVQSFVTQRLQSYSRAWAAGDEAGVTESFVQRNVDEKEFALALGRLAADQKMLLSEQRSVPEAIASSVHMSETVPIITLNRPWHYYAYAASFPPTSMTIEDEVVTANLSKSGDLSMTLVNVQNQWLIDPVGWAKDRPIPIITDSLRRQLTLTGNAIAAIRAQNWDKLRGVVQTMHQQEMVDRISDSTNYQLP
jgi:hypothetical protein